MKRGREEDTITNHKQSVQKTTQDSDISFRSGCFPIENDIPKEKRRLDSIARLLEGDGICTAVCLIDNTIFVTTNNVDALI